MSGTPGGDGFQGEGLLCHPNVHGLTVCSSYSCKPPCVLSTPSSRQSFHRYLGQRLRGASASARSFVSFGLEGEIPKCLPGCGSGSPDASRFCHSTASPARGRMRSPSLGKCRCPPPSASGISVMKTRSVWLRCSPLGPSLFKSQSHVTPAVWLRMFSDMRPAYDDIRWGSSCVSMCGL